MGKQEIKANYEHYYKPATLTDFPNGYSFYLIYNKERFDKIYEVLKTKQSLAVDLEATSLDFDRAEMVGVSLSYGDKKAFYFPFRHVVGSEYNLSIDHFYLLCELFKNIETKWYNFLYDGQVLEKEGVSVEDWKVVEVMAKVFNMDTNWKKIGLKWAERHFLGWKVMDFEEALGKNPNFSYVHPNDALQYAAPDSIGTWELDNYLSSELEAKSSFLMRMDNEICLPFLRIHQIEQEISEEVLDKVALDVIEKAPRLEKEIYSLCDRVFDIGSPAQVADILESMGIDTGARGKNGKMTTRAEFLEKIDHPIAEKIVRYKQIVTWENSYVKPLKKKLSSKEPIRFSYFLWGVPCLTKENWILTNNGVKSIADVDISKDYKIWTQFGWKNLDDWKMVGLQNTIKIVTKNGYEIEGTAHHPVSSDGMWKRLDRFKVGDNVDLASDCPLGYTEKEIQFKFNEYQNDRMSRAEKEYKVKIPEKLTLRLARLMGFIAGDGSIVPDGVKLCYWKEDLELIEFYSSLFIELFEKEPSVGKIGKDNTLQHKFCSVILRDLFKYLEVKEDKIPKIILESGPEAIYEFIAGYFDADGSLAGKGKKLDWRISSICCNRIKEIHKVLNILGFRNHLGKKNYKVGKQQLYIRMIHPQRVINFQNIVEPVCKRKRYGSFIVGRELNLWDYEDRVIRVEKTGRKMVYDITVEEVSEFIANGIITHNTGRTKAGKDKDNPTWFTPINIQAVVKPDKEIRWAHKLNSIDEGILGWEFNKEQKDSEDYMVEYPEEELNIRRAFVAPEGYYFCKFDYSGQELRIAANISKEPVWLEAFLNKLDLHSKVAKDVFKEDSSEERKKAKVINFCETGNNYVRVETGYKKVIDLKDEDKIIDRYDNEMNYAMQVVKNQPCVEMEFDNGLIWKYHERHKLAVWDKNKFRVVWKEVKDIDKEDQILSKVSKSERFKNIDKVAYLAGLYLGDGSRQSSRTIRVVINKKYDKEMLNNLPKWRNKLSIKNCAAADLYDFPEQLDYEWGEKKNKTIPDYVFNEWSNDSRLSLLAGLLDSDGTKYNNSSYIFQNTNRKLVQKVALLCNLLGIKTRIKESQPGVTKEGKRVFVGKNGILYSKLYSLYFIGKVRDDIPISILYKKNKTGRKSSLGFSVNKDNLKDFYKEVLLEKGYRYVRSTGLENLCRGRCGLSETIINRIKGYINLDLDESYYPVKILKRKYCEEDIYAIQVSSHEYLSGGLVSHNSIIYGSTSYSFGKKFGISQADADQYYSDYKGKHRVLFNCIEAVQKQAAREGVVYTAFGRPRRLYHWFSSYDSKTRAFARRSSFNTMVQGTGGDILRIGIIKLYKKILRKYPDKVKFRITVHDEINLCVKKECMYILDEIIDTLNFTRKDWPVPIIVGVEIGTSWGDLVSFKKEDGEWVPEKK